MSRAIGLILFLLVCAAGTVASAQESSESSHESRGIYGRDLMTPQERDAYRQNIWNLRTERERERFRQDHRSRMQNRAVQRGMPLPDEPNSRQLEEAPEGGSGRLMRDDGLRRWSPGESSDQSGFRRWPSSAAEGRGDGLRRLQEGGR